MEFSYFILVILFLDLWNYEKLSIFYFTYLQYLLIREDFEPIETSIVERIKIFF